MKINKRLVLSIASIAGTVVTTVLAFKSGTEAERILAECENRDDMTLLEKAKKVAPACVAPAVSLVATLAFEVMAHKSGTSAIVAAGVAGAAAAKKKLGRYIDATKEVVGKEKEAEIRAQVSKPETKGIYAIETPKLFHIDWLGKGRDIFFEATTADVLLGLAYINRLICDPNAGCGIATVSDFLEYVGHPELCNDATSRAGWQMDILACECGSYWIDSSIPKDKSGQYYNILLEWYPNVDIQQYLYEMEEQGIV